jgi:acetyl-CoA carboxylase biotin carboxyl carrier protein
MELQINEIESLMKSFDESSLSRVSLKNGKMELVLEKQTIAETQVVAQTTSQAIQAQPQVITAPEVTKTETKQETPEPVNSNTIELTSPMVGTFYSAPAPGAKPFVKNGEKVSKGQTIGILEAMKIMNEWDSEMNCKIIKILVEDGQPVEYGTPIFLVEKL